MDNLNDPCGEQYGTAGPVWNNFPEVYGDVKHLRNYRLNGAHTEMYFAPKSDIDREVLIVRYGSGDDFQCEPIDEISACDRTPDMKQAFEIAYDCARQRGYIS